ncbi:expressed unknown protein [Seminavis robusta]|uniref:Uncharacterized protein n=1 Tax=Seminavis robusta TaxID=568900 RepID=A0A9N8H8V1_9STRA|nr:expressed unknown protein [Seminavis robusta]|eukprot:Sro170_g075480.1 n/a (410) ;mRNA; r:61148-62377
MADHYSQTLSLDIGSRDDLSSALECLQTIVESNQRSTLPRNLRIRSKAYNETGARQHEDTLVWVLFSGTYLGDRQWGCWPLVSLTVEDLLFEIPVTALSLILQQTRNTLVSLHLCNVYLQGDHGEALAEAIKDHPILEKIFLKDLELTFTGLCDQEGFRDFIRFLSTCPQLTSVSLDIRIPRGQRLESFCVALEELWSFSSSLKHLSVQQPFHVLKGIRQVVHNIRRRRPPSWLEVNRYGQSFLRTQRTIHTIINSLATNSTLESLSLAVWRHNLLSFAEALKHNRTLRRLELHLEEQNLRGVPEMPPCVAMSFAKALKDNDTLEYLVIHGDESVLTANKVLQLNLAINRAGRKRLLNGMASYQEWIETIIANRDKLDIVFFFLAVNPAVLLVPLQRIPRRRSLLKLKY